MSVDRRCRPVESPTKRLCAKRWRGCRRSNTVFNYKALFAWCASAILVCSATWLFAGFGGKPHLADQACGNCHLVAGKEVDPAQAKRLVASQETLCGVCHKN